MAIPSNLDGGNVHNLQGFPSIITPPSMQTKLVNFRILNPVALKEMWTSKPPGRSRIKLDAVIQYSYYEKSSYRLLVFYIKVNIFRVISDYEYDEYYFCQK